jgi:hypothetical protein
VLTTCQRCWSSPLISDQCGIGKQGARSGSGSDTIAAAHGHDDAAGGGADQQVWQEPVLISIACMPFDLMRAHLNELKPSDHLRPALICFYFMRSGAAAAAGGRQEAGGGAAAAPPAAAVKEVAAAAGGHML